MKSFRQKQLKSAMSKIDETSTEAKELKSIVEAKLKNSIAVSNSEEIKNEADIYIVEKED